MRNRKKKWIIWISILYISAMLRLPGADWDNGFAVHPDERYLLDLSRKITAYGDPCSIDPQYPYGHFPLYLIGILFPSSTGIDPLYPARLLSGLMGVLLVAVTGASGLAAGEEGVGWIAAIMVGFAPLLVQSARFYTVDSIATTAATIAILAAIRKRWRFAGIAGAIAIASKMSLIWVWPVLMISVLWSDESFSDAKTPVLLHFRIISVLVGWGILTYVLASPWMIFNPLQCWSGPILQGQLVTGRIDYPYTLQYNGTLPYFYPIKQMALWGLGPVVTLVGAATFVAGLAQWRSRDHVQRIILLWVACYGAVMMGLSVKFSRYSLPLYPWIAILAAQGVTRSNLSHSHRFRVISHVLLCLFPTVVMGMAQASIYQTPHPWVTASQWLTNTLEPGDKIAYEAWDHPLPLLDIPNPYVMTALPVYDDESSEKAQVLSANLESADVIVIASRRGIGALSHNSERFVETLAWYKVLFSERDALIFTRCPRFGPLAFTDDVFRDNGLPEIQPLKERCNTPFVLRLPQLDESFRVYDTPTTILLLKTEE